MVVNRVEYWELEYWIYPHWIIFLLSFYFLMAYKTARNFVISILLLKLVSVNISDEEPFE